ncbi:MAG: hypothetical protein CME62_09470 [Halobacteriovoraceae bacterium]|nr:hypothetical protein [Halobacteriovoraceae bacterium]|tara:strand:+ start:5961 stop:6989 length:1029 start_codon:yes stop_codon:yes gene_type:complete
MKKILYLFLLIFILAACLKANSKPEFIFKSSENKKIAAQIGEVKISHEELNREIETELYKKRLEIFELKMNRLKTLLTEKLIQNDPKSKGLSNDQYLEKYILSDIKIKKSEIESFMQKQGVPKNQKDNPRVKERVVQYLKAQKKTTLLEQWLADQTKNQKIEVYFEKPSPLIYKVEVGKAPVLGKKSAPITIVSFSDFQCPYCSKAASVLKRVYDKYPDKVKLVFKHFPLSFHRRAKPAALASLCAHDQRPEAFWQMHDAFFFDKAPLGTNKIIELATQQLKLNKKQFEECFKNKKFAAQLQRDIEQAEELGIKGTPTVYLNGQLLIDSLSYQNYVDMIESM